MPQSSNEWAEREGAPRIGLVIVANHDGDAIVNAIPLDRLPGRQFDDEGFVALDLDVLREMLERADELAPADRPASS